MATGRGIIAGTTALAIGQLIGQGCVFARNVIIARLLTRGDYGVAASLALAATLLEMVGNLAVDRLLVQADDGDEERLQATAQALQATRGLLGAIALFILAAPTALLFDVPEATWAFRCIALVPLLRGLAHLDAKRFHRRLRYGPDVMMESVGQLLPTLLAWPLVARLGSYDAVLWLLVGQAAATTIVSHLVAERRYRWAWDRAAIRRLFLFGGPLLVDGLVMFGVFQGDRVIIGAAYSMEDLARYSVAFGLTFIPALVTARIATSLLLPLLSRARADAALFARRYRLGLQVISAVAAATLAGFLVAGPETMIGIYGAKYADAATLLGWLALVHAVRMLRVPAILAAMARGDTRSILAANLLRAAALLPALLLARQGAALEWIVICGLAGEAIAGAWQVVVAARRHGAPMQAMTPALLLFGGSGVAAAALAASAAASDSWWRIAPTLALALAAVAAGAWLLPDLRREARRAWSRSAGARWATGTNEEAAR